ncbi:MAG TPA: peptidylprolyl isomerase [Polyangiaceae bacterium]|nr:peptidylprolyl isomerase [Polyangiaceae bacterium]
MSDSKRQRSFQAGPGMWVRLKYRAFDEDDEPVEQLEQEIEYVHGYGALLPELETALDGQGEGAHRTVRLDQKRAFGPRRNDRIVEFDRAEFPPELAAGDHFDAEGEDGHVLVLRVLEVRDDAVVVDLNHPLAGQDVRFELEVLGVRPATPEEIELAEAALQAEGPVDGSLISAERLLRGPSRGYEMGPSAPPRPDGTEGEN